MWPIQFSLVERIIDRLPGCLLVPGHFVQPWTAATALVRSGRGGSDTGPLAVPANPHKLAGG